MTKPAQACAIRVENKRVVSVKIQGHRCSQRQCFALLGYSAQGDALFQARDLNLNEKLRAKVLAYARRGRGSGCPRPLTEAPLV